MQYFDVYIVFILYFAIHVYTILLQCMAQTSHFPLILKMECVYVGRGGGDPKMG